VLSKRKACCFNCGDSDYGIGTGVNMELHDRLEKKLVEAELEYEWIHARVEEGKANCSALDFKAGVIHGIEISMQQEVLHRLLKKTQKPMDKVNQIKYS